MAGRGRRDMDGEASRGSLSVCCTRPAVLRYANRDCAGSRQRPSKQRPSSPRRRPTAATLNRRPRRVLSRRVAPGPVFPRRAPEDRHCHIGQSRTRPCEWRWVPDSRSTPRPSPFRSPLPPFLPLSSLPSTGISPCPLQDPLRAQRPPEQLQHRPSSTRRSGSGFPTTKMATSQAGSSRRRTILAKS